MVERGLELRRCTRRPQVVTEVGGDLPVPEIMGGNAMLSQDPLDISFVGLGYPRRDFLGRHRAGLVIQAGGHDQVDTIGLAVHVGVDPGEFHFQCFRGMSHGAQNTETAGLADGGDDITAVAEGKQRELDAKLVADR